MPDDTPRSSADTRWTEDLALRAAAALGPPAAVGGREPGQAGQPRRIAPEELLGWFRRPGKDSLRFHQSVPVLPRNQDRADSLIASGTVLMAAWCLLLLNSQDALFVPLILPPLVLLAAGSWYDRPVAPPARRPATIAVVAEGLFVDGGMLPWRALGDVRPVDPLHRHGWLVDGQRPFILQDIPEMVRLVAGIEQVLAARREGCLLPGDLGEGDSALGLPPDGALSLARLTGEEDAERGISRADG